MNASFSSKLPSTAAAIGCAMLTACAPLMMSAVSAGGSKAVSHTLDGVSYRTFTTPLPRLQDASLTALNRMGIQPVGSAQSEHGATITAKATERDIEIKLESISPKTTRMRVAAKNGMMRDTATSAEIFAQIERALGKT